jgi:Glyoxalase-like domain
MHKILLRTFVFDFAPEKHDAGLNFWQKALQADAERESGYEEYHELIHPAAVGNYLTQQLGDGPSRVHLDIESSDRDAEVNRLVGFGARVRERFEHWTVLEDPTGIVFCVVSPQSDSFNESAIEVS